MKQRIDRPLDIVAVDDEPLALARLAMIVRDLPGARLVGTTGDADTALRLITERRPDILLLDIEMPGMSGIELASKLADMDGPRPFVIFITAFEQHALRAFQAEAIDYILKPADQPRLELTISRIRTLVLHQRMAAEARDFERRQAELRECPDPGLDPRDCEEIWALRGNEFVLLRTGDIERAESERDYVHLHNAERAFLLRTTLGALHDRLGHDRYVRVRRSTIVRLDRISAVRNRGYGDIQILLQSGAAVQVGRTYLKPLRQRLAGSAPAQRFELSEA